MVLALLCAVIQHWGNSLDYVVFLSAGFAVTGLLTAICFPLWDGRAFSPPRAAVPTLTGGSPLMAMQVAGFFSPSS